MIAPIRRMLTEMPVEGYAASGAAVRDMDQRPLLPKIAVPTLLIAGRADAGTPPAEAKAIADAVPGAELVELDGAG